MTHSIDDELSRTTEREVTAVLIHLKKLLRIRNRLRSPLLQLPTETIIRVLSFVMAGLDSYFYTTFWKSIYGTCHRIHDIMCGATELWWRVDLTRPRTAHFILMRSKGNPRIIVSYLHSMPEGRLAIAETILDHWRDKQGFRGLHLHTLEFLGLPPSFNHLSWIFKQSLPRVRHLKIHLTDSDGGLLSPSNPMGLELPVDMPLQVLDLRNVTLSWPSQSHLFNGLCELHLDFKDCDPTVFILEDELFGILDASPRLEHLSLVWVGHEVPEKNGQPLPPKRILQLPNLASLMLDNNPMVIKYTLAYMGLPVITSLSIHTFVSLDIARTLKNRLFPEEGLPARLFLNPPIFTFSIGELDNTVEIDIGSIHLQFGFPRAQSENGREAVMTFIPSLVPASVTTLELECTQLTERALMTYPRYRAPRVCSPWKFQTR